MFKNIYIAPTCFGSQGIHHQGSLYSGIKYMKCIKLPDDGSLVIRNMLQQF